MTAYEFDSEYPALTGSLAKYHKKKKMKNQIIPIMIAITTGMTGKP